MVGLIERPYVVVANPRAGTGKAHGLLAAVESAMGGPPMAIVEPDLTPAFAQRLNVALVQALERSPSVGQPGRSPLVVCIGGDGTLSMTFDALREPAAATLAIVPCGSGNDLALTLGIGPGAKALDVLCAGVERAIDYGSVNGRRFLNCVGIGLDAEVAGMAARIRRRGLAKGFSYYLAALGGLFSVKPVGATIQTPEGSKRYEDLVMLTIGNGRWYGGGFHGAPNARIDDGILDCYAFADVAGFWRRLALMQQIRTGSHERAPNVSPLRTVRLTAQFDRAVAMHVDGELERTQRVVIELVPRGARILVPLGHSIDHSHVFQNADVAGDGLNP